MSDRDAYDTINEHIASINRKLNGMPTTRECWAFVAGFAFGAIFVLLVLAGLVAA